MAISPMMKHYISTKEKNQDSILFYRLGDFYEMFFEDAVLCSKELELTLTGKDCGLEARAPMCGIPYHAAEGYISKLIEKGYKVAICEQLTEPEKGQLVERDIIRIITPGTVMDESMLDEKKNNYIACVCNDSKAIGIAWADISTGHLEMTELTGESQMKSLDDHLARIVPAEIVCNAKAKEKSTQLQTVIGCSVPLFSQLNEKYFDFKNATEKCKKYFHVSSLSVYDVSGKDAGVSAVGALLEYLEQTQKRTITSLNTLIVSKDDTYMHLDTNTRRNLELTESMAKRNKKGSIVWLLDETKTSMGARKLKEFVSQPLAKADKINERLDAVEELYNSTIMLEDAIDILKQINDIERIAGKISYGSINPRDCIALAQALDKIPQLKQIFQSAKSKQIKSLTQSMFELNEIKELLFSAIAENPPVLTKDGGYIRDGFSADLDSYRGAGKNGKEWLSNYEQNEKQQTGIKNLRVGFNKVFGYYIEVTKSQLNLVPYTYQRRQTTTTGERYITQELKEMEEKILGSEDKAIKLETALYNEIKQTLQGFVSQIKTTATAIGTIDTLCSFAVVSKKHNYVKPIVLQDSNKIDIQDGRHPVVEANMQANEFVPNDTTLDCESNRTMVITGPNMAGKSTYLRQVAVITLLAHIGCFVPAKKAEIGVVDRIFTRIGASDDLTFGQSTFMVEMTEVSNIMNNATSKSLLILDEVGRGTSTFDGLSIAWAVIEYLTNKLKAKTLFATHYHELTSLEGRTSGIKNYRVLVKETSVGVLFLHKIARGSANKSFGIEVASLAGLPKPVLNRARELLKMQEDKEAMQTQLFDDSPKIKEKQKSEVENILSEISIENLTPMQAFATLSDLIEKSKK